MPTLFLIDGSSQMYRAYHAIRGLSGPDGRSTNAVYGFATMLRKLLADHHPEYIAASFDLPGPTFRDELVTDYKANRAPMPPDLAEQIPLVHEACEAMGVPILTSERYEADDVIGTLATQARAAGFEVAIVTGDKDFFQLVGDGVRVFNPRDEGTWYDAAGVVQKFGVRPDQVVDVLALMGDSIDNIKGVPGIGEKGARELIATHGSLETLIASAPTVTNKRYREGLLTYADQARESRELARIRTDVPVVFDADAVRYRGPSRERCYALFSSLGFRSLVAEFAPTAATSARDYCVLTTLEEVDALVKSIRESGRMGIGIIATGSSAVGAEFIGWSFSDRPGTGCYIPLGHTGLADSPNLPAAEVFRRLAPVLADPAIGKTAHDLKFVAIACAREGIALEGADVDTMVLSYLLDATRSSHDIEGLVLERANYRAISEADLTGRGAKALALGDVPPRSLLAYAAERADLPLVLAPQLLEDIERERLDRVYRELEQPLIPVLAAIERAGVKIDTAALAEQGGVMQTHLDQLSRRIYDLAGVEFNINSPKQLSDVLFEKLKLQPGKKTGKTRVVSTAVDVLEELALVHEVPGLVLKWRSIQKLKGTYVDALPGPGEPLHRTRAHDLQSSRRRDRAAQQQRPQSAEHPDPHGHRPGDSRRVRRRAGTPAHLRRLLADRAARAGAPVRRRRARGGVPAGAGHSRPDGRARLRRVERAGRARVAETRENHQLRAALRQDRVHARERHRRPAAGGAGIHRRVLRRLPRGARVHRPDARRRPRHRHRPHDDRPAPPRAGAHQPERHDPDGGRT